MKRRTTVADFREATTYPHWRDPKRRIALIIAGALHNVATGGPANGYGGHTEQLARAVRDRILKRLKRGEEMNFIALSGPYGDLR